MAAMGEATAHLRRWKVAEPLLPWEAREATRQAGLWSLWCFGVAETETG